MIDFLKTYQYDEFDKYDKLDKLDKFGLNFETRHSIKHEFHGMEFDVYFSFI